MKYSSLLRSILVTQYRVRLQEKTSAYGLTGCWITALMGSRLGSTPASDALTQPVAGTGVDPHLRKTSWI